MQADGTWSLEPTTPLPDGKYTLTAKETDGVGNVSGPSGEGAAHAVGDGGGEVMAAVCQRRIRREAPAAVAGHGGGANQTTVVVDRQLELHAGYGAGRRQP